MGLTPYPISNVCDCTAVRLGERGDGPPPPSLWEWVWVCVLSEPMSVAAAPCVSEANSLKLTFFEKRALATSVFDKQQEDTG